MFTFNFSEYLQHLDEAFLLFSLRRFSFELREQTQSNRKVYCTDNGLVTSASFRLSSDAGKLYENIIAIDLQKCAVEGALECYYWQGAQQEEVDFVVKQGTKVLQLIQVCLNLDDPKTKSREVRALVKAPEELKCMDLLIPYGFERRARNDVLVWRGGNNSLFTRVEMVVEEQ